MVNNDASLIFICNKSCERAEAALHAGDKAEFELRLNMAKEAIGAIQGMFVTGFTDAYYWTQQLTCKYHEEFGAVAA